MKAKRMIMVAVMAAFCIALLAGFSIAEEKLGIKGKIKDYDLEAKTLVIRTDDGKEMIFVIRNEKALIKLDDRLFKDDEVKIRYSVRDGKNVIDGANDLKGTKPGC